MFAYDIPPLVCQVDNGQAVGFPRVGQNKAFIGVATAFVHKAFFAAAALAQPNIVKCALFNVGEHVVNPSADLILVESEVGVADMLAVTAVDG